MKWNIRTKQGREETINDFLFDYDMTIELHQYIDELEEENRQLRLKLENKAQDLES